MFLCCSVYVAWRFHFVTIGTIQGSCVHNLHCAAGNDGKDTQDTNKQVQCEFSKYSPYCAIHQQNAECSLVP